MSNEKRIILTLILTLGVLLIYETFVFGPQQEAKRRELERKKTETVEELAGEKKEEAVKEEATKTAEETTTAKTAQPKPEKESPDEKETQELIPEEEIAVETGLWSAKLSNRGGTLKSFKIKEYYDDEDRTKQKELIHWKKIPYAPIAASFGNDLIQPDMMYRVHRPSTMSVTFRGVTKNIEVEKKFVFDETSYHFEVSTVITSHAENRISGDFAYWVSQYQGEEKKESGGWFSPPKYKPEAMCYTVQDGLDKAKYDDLSPSGMLGKKPLWTGIAEQYFITALIPAAINGAPAEIECIAEKGESRHLLNSLIWRNVTLKPTEPKTFAATVFAGPKKISLMKKLGVELDLAVDWGILGAICRPMLWTMSFFNSIFGNWGVAIIFLTIVVKLLLFPVTHKSFKSMREMQNLKPEIDKLKEKYGDDKTKLNQEMMEIYRKHGVNPLGGCLPMLLQMPIWFALYRTLYTAVDLYQAHFIPGWLDDLAFHDPYYILPVALGAVTFLQQAITPTTMDSTQAKMMKWFMPPFFTVIMLSLPAGLNLYIFVNSLLSILQQMIINKTLPQSAIIAAPSIAVKSDGGKKNERKGK
ncbi:MAG: membrane protein insertase YidC [Myxococcota bacterium]